MRWHLGQWQSEPWDAHQTTSAHSLCLATLAHLSVFVGCGLGMLTLAPVGIDRAVLLELVCCLGAIGLMLRSQDPIVQANARSAVNFHLNVITAAALSSVVIGIPFLLALVIKAMISPLVAAARVADDRTYVHQYDFLWQWLGPQDDRVGV